MIITFVSAGLCIFLVVVLVQFLHTVWWTPIRIQHIMASQGIKGPAYRFLHGNTKEIVRMRRESTSTPLDNSYNPVFARIMPDIHAWRKLYGRNYLSWQGPQAQLVVTDPESVKEIMNNKDGSYHKARPDQFLKKLLGDGIVGMVPAMIASVETMLERWRQHEGKEIEVNNESRLLSSEVISRTAFGSSYLEGEKIFAMLTEMGMISSRNRFKVRLPGIRKFLKSRDDLESDKLQQAIQELIIAMINKREEKMKRGEENNYGSDFLGSLLKANHDPDEKNRVSVDEMVDECITFYLAGQETTNAILAWSLLLLAIHTDWQEKARKEVFELFGQQNPNAEGIARLKIVSII
ncbi:hypothetical protein RHGRI_033772 [Rhododendron griersonianum]|uniref:Cytochrome P450 n=1 Tax=Rhododendron griersonianum TaxID=479676 RepID=A0AAV6I3M1_9ERIC|nr:hypothetical protein RHGRI_033772 [Rhododendron griersonianum]